MAKRETFLASQQTGIDTKACAPIYTQRKIDREATKVNILEMGKESCSVELNSNLDSLDALICLTSTVICLERRSELLKQQNFSV